MQITPSFLYGLEHNMKVLQTNTYANLMQYMWWQMVAAPKQSDALVEHAIFSLEAAKLYNGEDGGFKTYDVIRWLETNAKNTYWQNGLELTEAELSDVDGRGIDSATKWIKETTTICGYHPQKILAESILSSATLAYDGQPYFSATHRTNAVNTADGTYSNLHTTLGINGTLDAAIANLQTVVARIRALKTPTGYPRNLQIKGLVVPSALFARAQQLTQARILPAAATGGGAASVDNEPIIVNLGFGMPIHAPELGSAFTNGSDTTYYVLCQPLDEVTPYIYFDRQPFSIRYHDGITNAELDIADKLVWLNKGRNSLLPMHPFLLHKVTA